MIEKRMLLLKYRGKTPFLASCERCHLKFFTPRELGHKPAEAEQNLRNRFEMHECRPDDVAAVRYAALRTLNMTRSDFRRGDRGRHKGMDAEHTIAEIEGLERIYVVPTPDH